jgi:hypothetical protein
MVVSWEWVTIRIAIRDFGGNPESAGVRSEVQVEKALEAA